MLSFLGTSSFRKNDPGRNNRRRMNQSINEKFLLLLIMNFMVRLVIGGCQANHYGPENGCKACPSGRINPANAEDTWYAYECRCNKGFESANDPGYQGAPDYPCNQCKKGMYQNEETIAKNSCKEPIGCLPNRERTACTLCPGGGVPDPDPDKILSAQYGCINIQCSSGSGVVGVNSQGGCEDGMYKCDDKCAVSFLNLLI